MRVPTINFEPIKGHYTVWRFTSLMTGETVIVARSSEPDDHAYDFAHQRILWRGLAYGKQAALDMVKAQ
jgi:hypothetical protein